MPSSSRFLRSGTRTNVGPAPRLRIDEIPGPAEFGVFIEVSSCDDRHMARLALAALGAALGAVRDRNRDPGARRADPPRAGSRRHRLVVRRRRVRRVAAAAGEPNGPADDPGRDRLVRARPRLVRLVGRRARERALAEPLPRARRAPARRLPERLHALSARAAARPGCVRARGPRLHAERAERRSEHALLRARDRARRPDRLRRRPALARGRHCRASRATARCSSSARQ